MALPLVLTRFGAVIDDGRDDHADEDPGQLEPVEEREAEQFRFDAVVEHSSNCNRSILWNECKFPRVQHGTLDITWKIYHLDFHFFGIGYFYNPHAMVFQTTWMGLR